MTTSTPAPREIHRVDQVLRDFRPSDHRAVRELILAGLQERWGEAFDARANPDLDDIVASYLERGAEVVVVETDGAVRAAGMLVPDGGTISRLVRMSVAATHRRQGMARHVVAELIERARRREMTEVRVLTDTPWTSAVAMYRACGFAETGRDDSDTHFVMRL